MADLAYHPNSAARALASTRSRTIGVISRDTQHVGPASLLLSIERAADAAGYRVSITHLSDVSDTSVEAACKRFADQSADGVVLIAPLYGASALVASFGIPVLALGTSYDRRVASVDTDSVGGARRTVEHLLSLGHATVSHIAGPPGWEAAEDRIQGWRSALVDAGRLVPSLERGDWTARSGYEIGVRLATDRDITAVFAANDQMALGVLRALAESGRAVPSEVSVAGFDDIPEAAYLVPPLTTSRIDYAGMGRTGLEILVKLMEGRRVRDLHRKIEAKLIVRASTAPPPPVRPRATSRRRAVAAGRSAPLRGHGQKAADHT